MGRVLVVFIFTLVSLISPSPRIERILFIGNSLTLANPKLELGWEGYWGMASSQAYLDYKTQLALMIASTQGSVPQIGIIRADFHRWDTVEPELWASGQLVVDFDPDLVIIQMGDNATVSTPHEVYQEALLEIRSWAPEATFRVVGLWGGTPDDQRAAFLKRAAQEAKMPYVPIRHLHTVDNVASQYEDGAVAWHPDDSGMLAIAETIFLSLEQQTIFLPWITSSVYGTIPGPSKP